MDKSTVKRNSEIEKVKIICEIKIIESCYEVDGVSASGKPVKTATHLEKIVYVDGEEYYRQKIAAPPKSRATTPVDEFLDWLCSILCTGLLIVLGT